MKRNKEEILYSNKNLYQAKRKYNSILKKSYFNRNIVSINNKIVFLETIIKFFIKIIMFISIPGSSRKNKTKINELVNRIYKRFTGRDFAFIPVSFAFYLLVSFIPTIISVYLLLKLLPWDLEKLFLDDVLQKIIPGFKSILTGINFSSLTTYAVVIPLFITSLWVASGGFGKFIYSENYIYRHENVGNWFINRLKGFVTVFFISVFIFISMFIYLGFYKLIGMAKPETTTRTKNIYFYISFFLYLIANLYLGFSLLFKLTPSFKIPWSTLLPGVLIASVPTVIFITIFGYLTSLIDYEKFGIFGIFMYIALLVSNMSYFMYLGIIANEGYYKTYHSRYTISKKAWFKNFIKK